MHWREAAQRAHVVETLAERWQGEETRAATRRDQKESDELSQQMAAAQGAQPMIPATRTRCRRERRTSARATPTAGTEAPATPFDAILSLETLAAQIATDTVAVRRCLSRACALRKASMMKNWRTPRTSEGVDALAFLADLLNVAAVPRQAPVQDGSGELAANDDVMSGSTQSSGEELQAIVSKVASAGEDAQLTSFRVKPPSGHAGGGSDRDSRRIRGCRTTGR